MTDSYTQLLESRRTELASRGLSKLPHDFYRTTEAYLAETRRTYETELRSNPSSGKGELARQTFHRATKVARDLIDARMTKLVGAALQASLGGAPELPNSLPEERKLFDSIVGELRQYRRTTAPYLLPDEASKASAPVPPPSAPTDVPPAAPALVYVRVTHGGRSMELGPETLDLRTHDLLSLPPDRARLLVQAKVATRLTDPFERRVT
ncbi:MAG: hypothetical protein ACYCPV_02715 [Thermoplasmata archaeon]